MRRRWVYFGTEAVEVSRDYTQPLQVVKDSTLWNDRSYQDMGDSRFNSRTQHREFMKSRGLTTSDDFSGEWRKKEELRVKTKEGYDPTRKEDLMRAISNLNSRR